jgi:outer membrane protein OmpA-like peptidoglycan-associated protein
MRKLGLALSVAAMAIVPYAAASQEAAQPAPTADDFVCALSDDCAEEATEPEQPATPGGRPRINATRGFSLSRPTEPVQGDTKAGQTRTTNQGTAQRRTQRQTASRPAQGQTGSTAQARRVDLRLSFGLGSAALSDAAQAQMRVFAEALRRPQLANARVRIEGHTDSSGGRATNLALSQRRAQAVADFLIGQGIAPDRLEVRGYAYDRPLPGRPASARENRRVEAVRIS